MSRLKIIMMVFAFIGSATLASVWGQQPHRIALPENPAAVGDLGTPEAASYSETFDLAQNSGANSCSCGAVQCSNGSGSASCSISCPTGHAVCDCASCIPIPQSSESTVGGHPNSCSCSH
jgi:hypothetical protein